MPEAFKKWLLEFLTKHPDDAAAAAAYLDGAKPEDAINEMLGCLQSDE